MVLANAKPDSYLRYLCDLAGATGRRDKYLAMLLDTIEYTYFVDNDENRAEDGKQLRINYGWINKDIPCSVLEMLLGVSLRMQFFLSHLDNSVSYFYDLLIGNLNLRDLCQNYEVEDQVFIFLERRYKPNGYGGLFPLNRPFQDQRRIEVWYQMMAYIEENFS